MERIKNRKSKTFTAMSIVNMLVFMWLTTACGDLERGQYAVDNVPPGQVSNVEVENVPGGAVITYRLPADDDLLYVKVVYAMPDGTRAERKSSTSKIIIEGMGLSKKQTVQLISGDQSGNESAPVSVVIEPLDAPIYEILQSMQMVEDFGGVRFTWDNPLRANIVLTFYVLNEKGRYDELGNVYSTQAAGKYNIRGYPSEEYTFAVAVRDRWNNRTGMTGGAFVPLFEEQLDRTKFRRWNPLGIPYMELNSTWSIEKLWDGNYSVDPGYSTPVVIFPISITFDMGQTARLNRIKVYQRTQGLPPEQMYFNYANVKQFRLYGSPTPDVTESIRDWIFLGDFTSVKPSGLPLGQLTEEDMAYVEAGEEYIIEDNSDVPVQYIRIYIISNHGNHTNAQLYEIEFFGLVQDEEVEEIEE